MGSGISKLVVPQYLKFIPLYVLAWLKHTASRISGYTTLDKSIKAASDAKPKPVRFSIQSIFPDLYPIHNLEEERFIISEEEDVIPLPPVLQLTARSIEPHGAYLMDAGDVIYILVCPDVNADFLNFVLGVPSYKSIPDDFYKLPVLGNLHNLRLRSFINFLNVDKPYQYTMHIMREDSRARSHFYDHLIADRGEHPFTCQEYLQNRKVEGK